MPRQARSRATVDALVQATAHVLIRDGYERASTNRIAARAGVNIGSLYQYFPGKEALVAAVVERHREAYVACVAAAMDTVRRRPPGAVLPALVRAHLAFYAAQPTLCRTLYIQVPRIGRLDVLVETRREMTTLLTAYLRSRPAGELRVGDRRAAAHRVVHVVDALTHAALFEGAGAFDEPELAVGICDVVLRYLLP